MSDQTLKMAEDPRWIEAYQARRDALTRCQELEDTLKKKVDEFRIKLRQDHHDEIVARSEAYANADVALTKVESVIDAERAETNIDHPLVGKVFHLWKYTVFTNRMIPTQERAYIEVLTEDAHKRYKLRNNGSRSAPRVGELVLRSMKLNNNPGMYYCSVPPALLCGKLCEWCLPGVDPNVKPKVDNDKNEES